MRVKKKKVITKKYDEDENLISKEVKIIEKEFEEENDKLPKIWEKDPHDPFDNPMTITWHEKKQNDVYL